MTNLSIQKKNQGKNLLPRITSNQSSTSYEPGSVQQYCKNIDLPAKAFDSGLPSLASLKKEYGEQQVEALIKLWIIDIAEFVNIGKNITQSQIEQTAALIIAEYYYLNVADVNLIFKRVKTGYYGEIYDRLDGQIILKWFRDYNKERCLAAEDENINNSSGFTDANEKGGEAILKRICEIQCKLKK